MRDEQEKGQVVKQLLAAVTLGIAAVGYAAAPALGAVEGDREIAKAGVFQADDFPAGWRATPPQGKESRLGGPEGPGSCPVVKKAEGDVRKNRTAQVQSRHSAGPGAGLYVSFVAVVPHGGGGPPCLRGLGLRRLPPLFQSRHQGLDEKKAKAEDLDAKVEGGTATGTGIYGDESSGMRFKLTLSKRARSQEVFADYVYVRVGRSIGGYNRVATSEPSEFDMPTFDGLITAATDRLTTAIGDTP